MINAECVVCDIKVGRRSILEYVLNPITRVIAFHPSPKG